jgi:hypothetical protein
MKSLSLSGRPCAVRHIVTFGRTHSHLEVLITITNLDSTMKYLPCRVRIWQLFANLIIGCRYTSYRIAYRARKCAAALRTACWTQLAQSTALGRFSLDHQIFCMYSPREMLNECSGEWRPLFVWVSMRFVIQWYFP